MNEPRYLKILASGLAAVALALLVAGACRSYTLHPDPDLQVDLPPVSEPVFIDPSKPVPPKAPPPPPMPAEVAMSDIQILENTTFTGVVRKENQLYYNYNPLVKRGKRGCPT